MSAVGAPRIQRKRLQEQLGHLFNGGFRANDAGLVGVVWPTDEDELAALVRLAADADSPLVPRGTGTSPYAAWTAHRGLIVSFEHMNEILAIDQPGQLVRLQPGVVWQTLIDALRPSHLMPLVYPSSGAVSTVGGFIAQGGAGIGSFQYGRVENTVEALRLVDANAQEVTLNNTATELAVGAEGRTGLLSEVTLRLQPLDDVVGLVSSFGRIDQLEECIRLVGSEELPIWSASFIDSAAASVDSGRGQPRRPLLSATHHSLLLSFRANDEPRVVPRAQNLVSKAGGTVSNEVALHEHWLGRFMGLQTLHTTPLPLQYNLPAGKLALLAERVDPRTRAKLGFEGAVVNRGDSLVVRVFQLTRAYSELPNLAFARELTRLVHKMGGSLYSTGSFFLNEDVAVYGQERLDAIRRFRSEHDPRDLLNPGKAFRP